MATTETAPPPTADLVATYLINFDATTGPFLGFATLVDTSAAILHPTADRALSALSPMTQIRLRVQISVSGDDTMLVADGTVALWAKDNDVRLPPLVKFDDGVETSPARDYHALSVADLSDLLDEADRLDPAESPFPSPDRPGPPGQPGIRGWWCNAWPRCPGC